jgi:hypothetical protein
MHLSKIKRRNRKCPVCRGDGFLINMTTESEHHPNCTGDCVNCPIPVPGEEQVQCDLCFGEKWISPERYRYYIIQTSETPLKACERIEEMGLNE